MNKNFINKTIKIKTNKLKDNMNPIIEFYKNLLSSTNNSENINSLEFP